jgi:hypothetical protein
MNTHRQQWAQQQQLFRQALFSKEQHEEAIRLFLSQHAMAQTGAWSFEDEARAIRKKLVKP